MVNQSTVGTQFSNTERNTNNPPLTLSARGVKRVVPCRAVPFSSVLNCASCRSVPCRARLLHRAMACPAVPFLNRAMPCPIN
ncbi:hypothetical protein RHMOL_Rhmol02G0206200 [Rhododendron molle]|uniref:Uncharacterized protein n=1 Tax=Rhododendron molle TaxID=49168 RepID=A0ACC0PV15_RHOML|nr:hypothetical protein RHMOL_Rhmol02G0206200 [Rhododendron molle]